MAQRIKEFPNYFITIRGNIFNKNNIKIKQQDLRGYKRVFLWKKGKVYNRQVHRLVAQTFIPNINKYPCVNHKDCIKSNNKVSNLEWCTWKMNSQHAKLNNRFKPTYGEKHYVAKLTNKNVKLIRKLLSKGIKQSIIAKRFGVYASTISDINTKTSWKQL